MDKTPYVVSGDISRLLQEWAAEKGFVLPGPRFFAGLRSQFHSLMFQIFPGYQFVSEYKLLAGLEDFVYHEDLPVISLDKVFLNYYPMLEISRLVGVDGQDLGLGARAGSKPIEQQLEGLRQKMPTGIKRVVLSDDILWTGEVLLYARERLQEIGIEVARVCVGIEIEEFETCDGVRGGRWFEEQTGLKVRSVCSYPQVIDQICERDFYPGVPLCGRQVVGLENTGVPYLLPFGNPGKWASIPEGIQLHFSRRCLEQTEWLFSTIERLSKRLVRCSDLGRQVFSLPDDETSFLVVLRKILETIREKEKKMARTICHY